MNFNPVEIFKIAQVMEENAIQFYTKAMDFIDNDEAKDVLGSIVKMEKEHLIFFTEIEKNFMDKDYVDSDEIKKYLEENFDSNIYKTNDAENIGTVLVSILDIYNYAKVSEDLAVDYYSFVKSKTKNQDVRNSLEFIIEQEKEHAKKFQYLIDSIKRK